MIKLFRAGAAVAAILTAGLIGFGTPAAAADNDHRWGGSGERHADNNGWRGDWGRDRNGGRDHDGRWDHDRRGDHDGWRGHDGRRDHDGWRDHDGRRGHDRDRWDHGRNFGWRGDHDGRANFGGWRPGPGHGGPQFGRGSRGW